MANLDTFNQFLTSQQIQVNNSYVAFAIILAAILSWILAKAYVKYGTSLSNRKRFSSNFVILATTTTLIIAIVKSSLALSLGLVGALSIVRFRAAIKEPEELAFLFLNIAIGLGLGAGQVTTTVISFSIILLLISSRSYYMKEELAQNLHLTISGEGIKLKEIVSILRKNCSSVHLKRFDQEGGQLESSFFVEFDSFEKLDKLKTELNTLSKKLNITYLDKAGFY